MTDFYAKEMRIDLAYRYNSMSFTSIPIVIYAILYNCFPFLKSHRMALTYIILFSHLCLGN